MLFQYSFADPPKPLLTPAPQAPGVIVPNRGTATPVHVAAPDLLFAHWSTGQWVEYSTLAAVAVIVTAIALAKLAWMLHASRAATGPADDGILTYSRPPRRSFTLFVTVRHDHDAILMSKTLYRLAAQDHPDFEIIAIVGNADETAESVARRAADRHPGLITVVVDESVTRSRPRALNRALEHARGDVVGVFSAGDDVNPHLLRLIDSRFSETTADVLQGGVRLLNYRTSWWMLRSVLENNFWLRSGSRNHANPRFVPLDDNAVFVKRNWLEWSAGWDEGCVTEDYELGMRLASGGAKVAVAYSPDFITREKVHRGIGSLVAGRARADLGSLQISGKGDWRKLPFVRQRAFARFQFSAPFLQPVAALLVPVLIVVAFLVKAPVVVELITLVPLGVALVTLAVEVAGVSEFGTLYNEKVRFRDYAAVVLGAFPFQLVLFAASVRALGTALVKDYSLEKSVRPRVEQDVRAPERRPVGAAR